MERNGGTPSRAWSKGQGSTDHDQNAIRHWNSEDNLFFPTPSLVCQTHVQHLIGIQHAKVWGLLRDPSCHVYVCGDSATVEEAKAEVRANRSAYISVQNYRAFVPQAC